MRESLANLVARRAIRIIVTPVLVGELLESPFGGVPDWFPIETEPDSVAALGHWSLGMAQFGSAEVYRAHRGSSDKTADAIIADSAASLADVLVTNDHRCKKRLAALTTNCIALTFAEFTTWVANANAHSERV